MFIPQGVNSAMMTPFDEDGKVNEIVLRQWIDFMIENGVNGLFPASSIGEFIHMSIQECYKIMDIVVEQAAGRVPVFPGACSSATDNSIKLAKYAEKIGCKAAVVMAPYYSPVSQEIVLKHFEKVAGAVNISIIIYNLPQCTTPIELKTFEKVLSIRNITAIKDSSGSMINLTHMIDLAQEYGRDDFGVLTGWDDMQYPALAIGAKGCITGVCGVIPEIATSIYREFKAGNMEKALQYQRSMLPVLRTMSSLQFPSGYKMSLDVRGFAMGAPRQPVDEIDKYQYLAVRKKIQDQLGKLLGEKLPIDK